MIARWIIAATIAAATPNIATGWARTVGQPPEAGVNRGLVELETSRAGGISVRTAEDLANIVDDGATRRVLPVVGKGGLQNLTDLKLLHGVDMAILQIDVLDHARQQNLYPGIENSVTYISKLYNEEFHLLAGPDIKTVSDLANQKVNVDLRGGGSAITAARLFDLLKIPVLTTNDDQDLALDKLRKGELAAIAFVAGKPAPLFRGLSAEGGLHFLSIPLNPAVIAVYAPTRLTAGDYPGLVHPETPIDTVAVGTVLMAANLQMASERYRNLVNFVDTFFTGFQSLLDPGHHPKWREVNIAAEVPGWRRYPPAEQWLQRNQIAGTPSLQDLKAIFSRFIDERQQASGGAPLTTEQKNELFGQFELWQKGQIH